MFKKKTDSIRERMVKCIIETSKQSVTVLTRFLIFACAPKKFYSLRKRKFALTWTILSQLRATWSTIVCCVITKHASNSRPPQLATMLEPSKLFGALLFSEQVWSNFIFITIYVKSLMLQKQFPRVWSCTCSFKNDNPEFDNADSTFVLNAIHVVEKTCVEALLLKIAAGTYEKPADSTFGQYLQAICDKESHNPRARFVVRHLHARLAHRDKLYAAWHALASMPALELLQGW